MWRGTLVALVAMGLALAQPSAPAPVVLGDLTMAVVATARRLPLDGQPPAMPRAQQIIVSLRLHGAPPDGLERILEPARGATLIGPDGAEYMLTRVQPRGERGDDWREVDLVFAGTPPPGARVTLRGTLVRYQRRQEYALEVSDLAQPVGAVATVGDVALWVERLAPVSVGDEERWYFVGRIERQVSPEAVASTQWGEDRLELLDTDGTLWGAHGLQVGHGGGGARQHSRIVAYFPLPAGVRPAALRFHCIRYDGVSVSPFEFTGLPLP